MRELRVEVLGKGCLPQTNLIRAFFDLDTFDSGIDQTTVRATDWGPIRFTLTSARPDGYIIAYDVTTGSIRNLQRLYSCRARPIVCFGEQLVLEPETKRIVSQPVTHDDFDQPFLELARLVVEHDGQSVNPEDR